MWASASLASPWRQLLLSWLVFFCLSTMYIAPAVLAGLTADDLGKPAGDVAMLPVVNGLTQIVFSMPAGFLLHRAGVCRCIAIGVGLFCLGMTGCMQASSLPQLFALQFLFGIAACLSGPGPLLVFLNSWFAASKATAVGVLFTAFGVCGMVWPPILASVGEASGWRSSYGLIALMAWSVAFPVAALLMRDGPCGAGRQHEPGTTPPTCTSSPEGSVHAGNALGVRPPPRSTRENGRPARLPWWVLDAGVWHLAAFGFWSLYVCQSLNSYLPLYLSREAGLSLTVASFYTSIIFALNMAGKVLFGVLLDRPNVPRFALGALALWGIGAAMLPRVDGTGLARVFSGPGANVSSLGGVAATTPMISHAHLVAFAAVYGLGYGGVLTLVMSKPIALYGSTEGFPKLQGFLLTWLAAPGYHRRRRGHRADAQADGLLRASVRPLPLVGRGYCHTLCSRARSSLVAGASSLELDEHAATLRPVVAELASDAGAG